MMTMYPLWMWAKSPALQQPWVMLGLLRGVALRAAAPGTLAAALQAQQGPHCFPGDADAGT